MWPYGYTLTDVPADMTQDDHDVFVAMGQAMAATNGYTPQQSSDLYITDGTIDDWLYGVHRIFSYTFEMYPVTSGAGRLLSAGRGDPGPDLPQPRGGPLPAREGRLPVCRDRQGGPVLRRRAGNQYRDEEPDG